VIEGGVYGVVDGAPPSHSVNSRHRRALDEDLTMDPAMDATTMENRSFLFNNDDTFQDLITRDWNTVEDFIKPSTQKSSLETPDCLKEFGPDLGFDSWSGDDLGATLDNPFFEMFVDLNDSSLLDPFPEVSPLGDGVDEASTGNDDCRTSYMDSDAFTSLVNEVCESSMALGIMNEDEDAHVNIENVGDVLPDDFLVVDGGEEPEQFTTDNDVQNTCKSSDFLDASSFMVTSSSSGESDTDELFVMDNIVTESTLPSEAQYTCTVETLEVSTTVQSPGTNLVSINLDELMTLSGIKDEVDIATVLSSHTTEPVQTEATNTPVSIPTTHDNVTTTCPTTPPPSAGSKRRAEDDAETNDLAKAPRLEGTQDKKTMRRIKNNIASRHSRASRKSREKDLLETADKLEIENTELRSQVEELTRQTSMLRNILVQKLSGRTT